MPLACVWDEEQFYTADPVPWNGAGGLVDRKPWVSTSLSCYLAELCNLPCIWTLYKHIFNASNQLATCIICMKRAVHHTCVASQ